MTSNDPRRQLRTGGDRGRMDGPPGWADSLFVGRSRADKEADQDAMLRVLLVLGGVAAVLLVGLHALFTTVGLQLGWWSVPVFVPLCGWAVIAAGVRRSLRPVELDGLHWRQRLAGGGVLLVLLWVVWPLWAGPAAFEWKREHGGFGIDGPRYPLHAILAASPVAMGLVVFLLLAFGMVVTPRVRERVPRWPAPPPGPEPLRAPLVSPERRPQHPRWP